jgi:hypothetical protein
MVELECAWLGQLSHYPGIFDIPGIGKPVYVDVILADPAYHEPEPVDMLAVTRDIARGG